MKQITLSLLLVVASRIIIGISLLHYGLSFGEPFQIAIIFLLFCCYLFSWLPSDTALMGFVVSEKLQLMQTFLHLVRSLPQSSVSHNNAYNNYSPTPSAQLPSLRNHVSETVGTSATIDNQVISLKKMGDISGVTFKLYSNKTIEYDGRLWSEQQLKDNLRTAQSQMKDPKRGKTAKVNYEKFSALLDLIKGVVPVNSNIHQNNFSIHH